MRLIGLFLFFVCASGQSLLLPLLHQQLFLKTYMSTILLVIPMSI